MRTRTRGVLTGLTLTGLLAAGLAAAGTAGADTATGTGPRTFVPSAPAPATAATGAAVGAAEAARTRVYWTPERMRAAVPARGPRSTTTAEPAAPATAAVVSASRTVGKVFYTNPENGIDYKCTGTALAGGARRVVLTAGHCVHNGGLGGSYMRNWTFVPGYRDDARPHGSFPAKWFTTTMGWKQQFDVNYDVGMVATGNELGSGRRLVDVVGGNTLAWNGPRSGATTIFGYYGPDPADQGMRQRFCATTVRPEPGNDKRVEAACGLKPGSSGGPWFRDYNSATGLGRVEGVLSEAGRGSDNVVLSPYFGPWVKALYDQVANLN